MYKKLLLVFFIIQFNTVFSQEQTIKAEFISKQNIDADVFVGFDGMGNLYYLKNNVFFMKNKQFLWQYKNISLGKATRIDIQNPLKILLFYENFNTIILLDNQLSEIQKINLSENETPIIAAAIGVASGNRLWIYNSISQQIGLFDYLNNTFQTITPSFKENLKYYESNFNSFQWIDNNLNWLSCDVFGKSASLGKVADFDTIQSITSQAVVFTKEKTLYIQDLKKNKIYKIENIENSSENFYYKDQILSIFTNQEITNYKITIP